MSKGKSFESLSESEKERMLLAAKSSPVLRGMIRDGDPLTRETWLALNGVKEPLDPELEAEVPEPFRK